jgi:hypothetical protein
MTDRVRVGTAFIADDSHMPATLVVGTKHYSAGWSSIIGYTSAQLGIHKCSAGQRNRKRRMDILLHGWRDSLQRLRLQRSVPDRSCCGALDRCREAENCNCLQITQMRRRSFLGLPYTSLIAHARHIQRSRSFQDLSSVPVRIRYRPREWLYDQTPRVRSKTLFVGQAVQTWENEGGSRA